MHMKMSTIVPTLLISILSASAMAGTAHPNSLAKNRAPTARVAVKKHVGFKKRRAPKRVKKNAAAKKKTPSNLQPSMSG
jgi:hypothetical protein